MLTKLLLAGCATLIVGAASAADLPRRAAPPVFVPVPVFTWTGFYFGINAGYAWSEDTRVRTSASDPTDVITPTYLRALGSNNVTFDKGGFTGGGQIGYNYQFTPGSGVVVGIEADAAYTDLSNTRRSTATIVGFPGNPGVNDINLKTSSTAELSYLGTVRGRVGYAFDRFLVYGTGGFAYGQADYSSVTDDGLTLGGVTTPTLGRTSARYSNMKTGYAYGGGIEYALPTDSFFNFFRASAVTFKVEYLHYDLGNQTVTGFNNSVPAIGASTAQTTSRVRFEGDIARAGINYKFGTY